MKATRKDVIKNVKEILDNNPQIDKCFYPIIQEFFIRLVDQIDLERDKLDIYIDRYKKLKRMKFNKIGGYGYYRYKDIDGEERLDGRSEIIYSIDYLKYILLGNKEKIEEFINTAFHEQGHCIQSFRDNEGFFYSGLESAEVSIYAKKREKQGIMINELAEIINSHRLTNGNLNEGIYHGYKNMQPLEKVFCSSLGITEEELGNLQMYGRDVYESVIEKKIGKEHKEYITAFEKALDVIYLATENNLLIQIENINNISNELLKIRLENLKDNFEIKQLASIIIDKEKRDTYFLTFVKKYITIYELPMIIKDDIKKDIINMTDMIENIIKEKRINVVQLQKEIYKLKKEEEKRNSKAKVYDNSELQELLISSMQNYDCSKFPLAIRIQLALCKKLGNIKRDARGKNVYSVTEVKSSKKFRNNMKLSPENYKKHNPKEHICFKKGNRER